MVSGLAAGARALSWYVVSSLAVLPWSFANRHLQPGGQDSQIVVKELATSVRANYMLQTADEPPAYIIAKSSGWLTGAKDVLEKLNDPNVADTINPSTYKYRTTLTLETGDERYAFVNTLMWVCSCCRRGQEGESTSLIYYAVNSVS